MPPDLWHAEPGAMRLDLPRASVVASPQNPAGGLSDWQIDKRPFADFHPLRIALPAVDSPHDSAPPDFYVRGGDLIVTYAERPELALRAQLYYRAASHLACGAIAAVEMVASVQTSVLDSCPRLRTRSDGLAREAFQLSDLERATFDRRSAAAEPGERASRPHCYLWRFASAPYSYAEMVSPADAQQSELICRSEGENLRVQLSHGLFAERLEKGVILRARVLGVLLDREGDQAAAASHYAAFLSEELPLTT